MSRKSKLFCGLVALSIAVSACVTVNVNFPESAVQKATDDYVQDLYRTRDKERSAQPAASPSPSAAKPDRASPLTWMINFGESSAYADGSEPDFTFHVDSPKAQAIKQKLVALLDDVVTQKKAGVLGETNEGLVVIHAPEKLKPLLKKKVETLVKDENEQRSDLYDEIVSANHMAKSRRKDVELSFARSFQAHSPAGTWIQDSDGKWSQKQ